MVRCYKIKSRYYNTYNFIIYINVLARNPQPVVYPSSDGWIIYIILLHRDCRSTNIYYDKIINYSVMNRRGLRTVVSRAYLNIEDPDLKTLYKIAEERIFFTIPIIPSILLLMANSKTIVILHLHNIVYSRIGTNYLRPTYIGILFNLNFEIVLLQK